MPGRNLAVPGQQLAMPGRNLAVPGQQLAVPGRHFEQIKRLGNNDPFILFQQKMNKILRL
ncbi:MAG: hypothetical protein GY940_22015 [bacterium]|nr:hypothetical protein [bacterium]